MARQQIKPENDEIDLRELFGVTWQSKWLIIFFSSISALLAVIYVLSLPNIYKSEVLLSPVVADEAMKIPGQLGGLAALAGVNLSGGSGDKTALALEIIKSRDFLGRFITKYDLFVPIMAAKDWNSIENSLIINDKIYDVAKQEWVRKVKAPFLPKPSLLETHEEFLKLLNISKDKATKMVRLSIEYYSPYLAKKWLDLLVIEINDEMRQLEISEAESSLQYLNAQLDKTTIKDVQSMFFSLIEEQTKTLMLANARKEYVLKTVDSAVVAEKKDRPARALIVIFATFLAFSFTVLIVLIRHFSRNTTD
ncbi:Wzz/FepE/Etk N-terminal domain-containing protein [Rheinheimera metallidurans]|uniref:Wzz/FepE/Etk N-terminal domain-containing protein n=1 Tax=Rheinheimera metallidurans TaxID=2925781 RepID=UPI003001C47E